jgi:hypothetical protein
MQASAHQTDPKAASLAAVKHCAINCGIVGLLVDPQSPAVSRIHLELTYDSTL